MNLTHNNNEVLNFKVPVEMDDSFTQEGLSNIQEIRLTLSSQL